MAVAPKILAGTGDEDVEEAAVDVEVTAGSREIVFFLPRFVVPGTFGPVELDVYLIISVSCGNFTSKSSLLLIFLLFEPPANIS